MDRASIDFERGDEANRPSRRLNESVFLAVGLRIAGFGPKKLAMRTQLSRFKSMYGCLPVVAQHIWYDLQGVLPGEASKAKIHHLFWALFFLKRYPTEGEMSGLLKKDPKTIRKWVWAIIFGIQDLKAEKIKFSINGSLMSFVVSVDGTDCRIEEPGPFSTKWFSQKFKGPAVKYEVALDVLTGDCVWVNGPFKGGTNDVTIYRSALKDLIPNGKFAITNKGYRGEPATASCPNHLDDDDVREFKKRVRARHETFNARLKSFAVLSGKFRHKPVMDRHKACFEAVAVIVQYTIELGSPLFYI